MTSAPEASSPTRDRPSSRHTLVLGAGASLASPACRPDFKALRNSLLSPLRLGLDDRTLEPLAPEALLSRLHRAGIDVDAELRRMLGGGRPNAVHRVAAEALRRGEAVWTTNFDELVESACEEGGIAFHRILPGDDVDCGCESGHIVKLHGTLSAPTILARSEEVLVPLDPAWLERLRRDCEEAEVTILGYAGADIDLRFGLDTALIGARRASWFTRPEALADLRRRFPRALGSGVLRLEGSDRPDLDALSRPELAELVYAVPEGSLAEAREKVSFTVPKAGFQATDLSRAALLDAFGRIGEARRLFARSARRGPHRGRALRALYSPGMIHGARWRGAVVGTLNALARTPVRWEMPHVRRLPYLTWNLTSAERLPYLERSLGVLGENLPVLNAAANAAKEVEPRRAVELGGRAQGAALEGRATADAAWATFILSLAWRSIGDLAQAEGFAETLDDGYANLAGPGWTAWASYEKAAIAALRWRPVEAERAIALSLATFGSIGSSFATDAACAQAAIRRAAGDRAGAEDSVRVGREALDNEGHLRLGFREELLAFETAELLREEGELADSRALYADLVRSPNLVQEILGLIGLGEVERRCGEPPESARRALRRSKESGFGYGQVHAALTLGLARAITEEEAEEEIRSGPFEAPQREGEVGLRRFCQGPDPDLHLLCFPC